MTELRARRRSLWGIALLTVLALVVINYYKVG